MPGSSARTVLGTIATGKLGVTYAHEHLAAHASERLREEEPDLLLDDASKVQVDLETFQHLGGRTIVEMTTRDYGHDPEQLRRLSEATGVHVIAATGFNKGVYNRQFCEGQDPSILAREQIADVESGIGSTGVFAGVHKFGTSLNKIEPWEEIAARAAARAHLETGAPIVTHTEAGTMAESQLDLLETEGVPPHHIVLCHLDRNPDLSLHKRLIRRGAFISYDQIPKPKYQTESSSIDAIVALAKEDLHVNLLISGDFSRRSYFVGWGGTPGLGYLLDKFTERLKHRLHEAGLDADAVWRSLFVDNPARAFALS